ncbi:MAG TPA: ABC transporter permease subunit [Micromonosporaceae bacterium]
MTTITRDGAAPGYRHTATLSVATEFRRQLSRRRTQLTLAFLVLLPIIMVLAFQFGPSSDRRNRDNGGFGLVDLATSGAANFTMFGLMVSTGFLLVVVVALFCGDTVASEASWGSLRYLLAVPVPRGRLLGVKLTVALLYSAIGIVILVGTCLLAGTVAFGWEPLRAVIGGEVSATEGALRVLAAAGYVAVMLLPVAGLAFFLSVSTDAPLGAVGGAVFLHIMSNILDAITALGEIRNLLPTRYAYAWIGLLSSPAQTDDMLRGALAALSYTIVFFCLAWWRFLRKDVTS